MRSPRVSCEKPRTNVYLCVDTTTYYVQLSCQNRCGGRDLSEEWVKSVCNFGEIRLGNHQCGHK
jgi:hypothetical protein